MQADASSAQQPILGTPSVYLFHRGTGELCMVLAMQHAGGSCGSTLTDALGTLRANRSIVDGKMFIWGLAANDVSSVAVSLGSTTTTPAVARRVATLANNVFLVSLPYNGGSIGDVTVTASRSDGADTSTSFGTIP
jgi:hypothetical protein